MARCKAEFLVEPFTEGTQGAHVIAAIDAVAASGLEPQVGPFGTSVEGEPAAVFAAIMKMVDAALANGASRVGINATVVA